MPNLRIESDGTAQGTKVSIDGKMIETVQSVKINLDSPDHMVEGTITVLLPDFNLECPVEFRIKKEEL